MSELGLILLVLTINFSSSVIFIDVVYSLVGRLEMLFLVLSEKGSVEYYGRREASRAEPNNNAPVPVVNVPEPPNEPAQAGIKRPNDGSDEAGPTAKR